MIEIIDAPFSRDLHPLFQRHARRNLTSVLACSARARLPAMSPPLRRAARLRALRADEGPAGVERGAAPDHSVARRTRAETPKPPVVGPPHWVGRRGSPPTTALRQPHSVDRDAVEAVA